jgi:hypothetical protein
LLSIVIFKNGRKEGRKEGRKGRRKGGREGRNVNLNNLVDLSQ